MSLSCRPARKLYTTSAESSFWPSDHLAFRARFSVSVLLPLLHFQLRASHGTGLRPPWPVTIRGSKNAPWTMEPLGSPVAVYGLKFLTKAGSPEPVMTRHLWPAEIVALLLTAAGLEVLSAAARAREAPATAIAIQRVEGVLRRIGCPFSPNVGAVEPWFP